MRLRDRDWKVRVAGIEFDKLDFDFEVEKTVRAEPNSCTLTIYGLNENSRSLIEQLNLYDKHKTSAPKPKGNVSASAPQARVGNIRVEIEAGYKDERSLIFRGDLRRAISTRNGATWQTVIEGDDGGRSVLSARVREKFPAGTPKIAVVKRCAEAMGVGVGNIVEVADLLSGVYSTGTVLDGSAPKELAGVLRRAGLVYSVQDGVLQYRRTGQGVGLKVQAVLISEETGMVGVPERDASGELLVTTLLIPNVVPGGYAFLKSAAYNGVYRIVGVKSTGRTRGTEWYHRLSLVPG